MLSKTFLIAAACFSGLHLLNIAMQLHSYRPLMDAFTHQLGTSFSTSLLGASVVFGYISAITFIGFALLLTLWVDKPGLFEVTHGPSDTPAAAPAGASPYV